MGIGFWGSGMGIGDQTFEGIAGIKFHHLRYQPAGNGERGMETSNLSLGSRCLRTWNVDTNVERGGTLGIGEWGVGSGERNVDRKGLAQKLPPRSPCQRESSGTRPPLRFSKLIWLSPGTWATKVLLRCAFPAPKTDTPFHRRRFPLTSTLFISHLPAPEIPAPVRRTCFSASGHASMCWP